MSIWKRRNDQSPLLIYIWRVSYHVLQIFHLFLPPYIKFLLKICSNHGIMESDYFILRHGHFVHGYYIWWISTSRTKVAPLVLFFILNLECLEQHQTLHVNISHQCYHYFLHLDNHLTYILLFHHIDFYQ